MIYNYTFQRKWKKQYIYNTLQCTCLILYIYLKPNPIPSLTLLIIPISITARILFLPWKVTEYCLLQCPNLASMSMSLCHGSGLLFLASISCTEQFFCSDSKKNLFKTCVIKSKKQHFPFCYILQPKLMVDGKHFFF